MDDLKSYLMNCDLEDLNEDTREKYEDIANMRKYTEKYWRDRIAAENQSWGRPKSSQNISLPIASVGVMGFDSHWQSLSSHIF